MVEELRRSPTPAEFHQEKRCLHIHGRATSVRLERLFWSMLEDAARRARMPLPRLIEHLRERAPDYGASTLDSFCRVVCLKLCEGTMRLEERDPPPFS